VLLSGTPASSTTKTGRHDIAEILLEVALSTINQSNQYPSKSVIPDDNNIIFEDMTSTCR
jgi:hypothetical protein